MNKRTASKIFGVVLFLPIGKYKNFWKNILNIIDNNRKRILTIYQNLIQINIKLVLIIENYCKGLYLTVEIILLTFIGGRNMNILNKQIAVGFVVLVGIIATYKIAKP